MADAYTSIQSGGSLGTGTGISAELVQKAYDQAVRWALHAIPQARAFVSVRPQHPCMTGQSVTLEKLGYFPAATITAAKTPLTEEADVSAVALPKPTPIVITPTEYGFATISTLKLENRTFIPLDPVKVHAVAVHMARVLDELVQDVLQGGTVVYPGSNVADGTLTTAMPLTADMVRAQVAKLRAANVLPWFGNFYGCLTHPFTVLDLRTDTTATGWRVPSEYGVSQENIWTGEIGEFEGVRFVQSNLARVTGTGASSANVFSSYFVGQGALAEAVVTEPGARVSPNTDKLGRFHGLGWYGDLGWGLYESKALYVAHSGASLGASYVASD